MTKICNKCGKKTDDRMKYCPYCKSQSFRNENEIVPADNTVTHKFFYWNYNGEYIISKTKVISLSVFLLFAVGGLLSSAPAGILFLAFIFAGITYMLGYGLHGLNGPPSEAKLANNDYGLGQDLIHLLFYWQNDRGEYKISKTKILSHMVFILFFGAGISGENMTLFTLVIIGLIFEAPTFLVGYIIHNLISPLPDAEAQKIEPKKEVTKPKEIPKPQTEAKPKEVIPEYVSYSKELDELQARFNSKDKSTRELIEKRFEPPQLTYTRFINVVDKSKKLFNSNMESARTMIDLADEYSPRIAGELENKIGILDGINDRLDSLSNELLINEDLSQKDDIDNLVSEMDSLIKSVKDYNQK